MNKVLKRTKLLNTFNLQFFLFHTKQVQNRYKKHIRYIYIIIMWPHFKVTTILHSIHVSSKIMSIKIHCFTDLGKNGFIFYLWNVWDVFGYYFHKKGGGDFKSIIRATVEIIFQMNLGQKMWCLTVTMWGVAGLATAIPAYFFLASAKEEDCRYLYSTLRVKYWRSISSTSGWMILYKSGGLHFLILVLV